MEDQQTMADVRGVGILNLILGVWLVISPHVLGYTTFQSTWNQAVAGSVIVIFALWRLFDTSARWASWISAVASAWLIITPLALDYALPAAYWNEIVVALFSLALSLGNAYTHIEQHTHHHAM
jgi:SPW repeat